MQRALGAHPVLSPKLQDLLQLVSVTYDGFDKERVLSERSLEISSKELRLLVATLRTTLDSVGEGILVIDENQKIAFFNKRFVKIWEIPAEEITPRLTEQVITTMTDKVVDHKFFRQIIDRANSGQEIGNDIRIKLVKNSSVAVKSYPQLLEGKNVGRIWSFRDITKYINFQEEIQDKVITLEQLNKTMVDRELKMIELKGRVEVLEQKLSKGG
jgi:PAS domain S-box-containing protein